MATRQTHYFAEDGNYGDADGLAVVETTGWTAEDWDAVEAAHDSERPDAARRINILRDMQEYVNQAIMAVEDEDSDDYGILVAMEAWITARRRTPAE